MSREPGLAPVEGVGDAPLIRVRAVPEGGAPNG